MSKPEKPQNEITSVNSNEGDKSKLSGIVNSVVTGEITDADLDKVAGGISNEPTYGHKK